MFFVFAQVTSSSPRFFEPCATAEWEVLMDDAESSELTTKLKMPEEIRCEKKPWEQHQ